MKYRLKMLRHMSGQDKICADIFQNDQTLAKLQKYSYTLSHNKSYGSGLILVLVTVRYIALSTPEYSG